MLNELERRELEYRLREVLDVYYGGSEKLRFVHLANAGQILREIEAWGYTISGFASTPVTFNPVVVRDGKCPTCQRALTGPFEDFCNTCKRPWAVGKVQAEGSRNG